uniref:SHSP domain-containing protein n=1 Tax=Panagrellus redivivus TaxID=6233 RepID=A0A7E4UU55_PANRE
MRRWGRKHGRRFGQVGPFGYGRRHHGMRQRSRKPEEDTTDFDIVKDVNELSLADSAPKPKKFKFVVKARGYAENDIKVTREKDEIVIEGRREKTTDDGTFSTTINHRIRVPEGIDADSELKTKLTRGHLFVVLKKPKTAAAPEEIVIDN